MYHLRKEGIYIIVRLTLHNGHSWWQHLVQWANRHIDLSHTIVQNSCVALAPLRLHWWFWCRRHREDRYRRVLSFHILLGNAFLCRLTTKLSSIRKQKKGRISWLFLPVSIAARECVTQALVLFLQDVVGLAKICDFARPSFRQKSFFMCIIRALLVDIIFLSYMSPWVIMTVSSIPGNKCTSSRLS